MSLYLADALFYAFDVVPEIHDDPSLKEMVFPIVAIGYENLDFFDDALVFDAKLSGKPIPDRRDVRDALMELHGFFPEGAEYFAPELFPQDVLIESDPVEKDLSI